MWAVKGLTMSSILLTDAATAGSFSFSLATISCTAGTQHSLAACSYTALNAKAC